MDFRPTVAALLCLSACAPAAFAADMPVKAVPAEPVTVAWTPSWWVYAGGIVLQRSRPAAGTTVAGNPSGVPFASGSDFQFDRKAGFDVSAGIRVWGPFAIDARYFSVNEAEALHNFVTPGNFIGAGFTGPGGTTFTGRYRSNLDSAEANLRYNITQFDRLTILAGYRWIGFNDRMSYKLNGNVATGVYEYMNHLRGAQVGAEFNVFDRSFPFQVTFIGKVAFVTTSAEGGIREFQGNNFIGSFLGQDKEKSKVYEGAINGSYNLTKNVALRVGYQYLKLDKVATGSDAAARSLLNPSLLRTVQYNSVHYQGVTAGASWQF
jgi:opacity protein-like surface antigen